METLKKQSLFWDIDLENLDIEKHKNFIVRRILERGDADDFHWAEKYYGTTTIKKIFTECAQRLDPKSRVFWRLNLSTK